MACPEVLTPPVSECACVCSSASINRLLQQISSVCESLFDTLAHSTDCERSGWGGTFDFLQHFSIQQKLHPRECAKVPRFSLLGLTSLLLGIASTLTCFGYFALLIGLMFMPFIVLIGVIAWLGVLISYVKAPISEMCSLFPASMTSRTDPILFKKLGFHTDYYEK
ncbi:hypothetical protein KP509_34G058200 [Ceratopteris richardii]|uniref:Transmembrane protein n=1 Tax=Ceratopteris richardii TaxID=49495 RepID=A0A8T2QKD8_CERRI|nr:hypothetical protein KP509_34G058200 [Ceratopteris richardii]